MKTKHFLAMGVKNALAAFLVVGLVASGMVGFAGTVSANDDQDTGTSSATNSEQQWNSNHEGDHEYGDHHDGDNNNGDDHEDGDYHDGNHDGDHDDNNGGDTNGGEETLGSIRVCILVLDESWNVLPSDAVSGVTFEVPGITETTVFGDTTGELSSTIVTTPLDKNTRVLSASSENDANCTTYSGLELGNYYYGQEVITGGTDEAGTSPSHWDIAMYHDDAADLVYTFDYFTAYSNHLFDADPSNDWNDIYTADGHIPLYQAEPDATLVVVNRLMHTNTNTGGDNGGGTGDTGGTGGAGDTGGTSGSGGGSVGSNSGAIASAAPQGQVLGESTCGVYLNDYLRYGYKNNTDEVKKLQTFLNDYLGSKLEVSGVFDRSTEKAVRLFQQKESISVLNPWGIGSSTGIVYITTKNRINNLYCSSLKTPVPQPLLNWKHNPETTPKNKK